MFSSLWLVRTSVLGGGLFLLSLCSPISIDRDEISVHRLVGQLRSVQFSPLLDLPLLLQLPTASWRYFCSLLEFITWSNVLLVA